MSGATNRVAAVITTIQEPTAAVRSLAGRLRPLDADLVIIGDQKGPRSFELDGARFFDLDAQRVLPFELARKLPVGHYTRKNVGYLEAIAHGADCLYETDDDNAPLAAWAPRVLDVPALNVSDRGWVNVYRHFSDQRPAPCE